LKNLNPPESITHVYFVAQHVERVSSGRDCTINLNFALSVEQRMMEKPMQERVEVSPRRKSDEWWRWAATFFAGMVISGAVSYFALWGAFIKDSVTRPQVESIVSLHSQVTQEQLENIKEQMQDMKKLVDELKVEQIQIKERLGYRDIGRK
jgi:hypothetical protein